jgi:hypothetical protein
MTDNNSIKALAIVIAASVVLYLCDHLYCYILCSKARGIGIFRDDRQDNDQR